MLQENPSFSPLLHHCLHFFLSHLCGFTIHLFAVFMWNRVVSVSLLFKSFPTLFIYMYYSIFLYISCSWLGFLVAEWACSDSVVLTFYCWLCPIQLRSLWGTGRWSGCRPSYYRDWWHLLNHSFCCEIIKVWRVSESFISNTPLREGKLLYLKGRWTSSDDFFLSFFSSC